MVETHFTKWMEIITSYLHIWTSEKCFPGDFVWMIPSNFPELCMSFCGQTSGIYTCTFYKCCFELRGGFEISLIRIARRYATVQLPNCKFTSVAKYSTYPQHPKIGEFKKWKFSFFHKKLIACQWVLAKKLVTTKMSKLLDNACLWLKKLNFIYSFPYFRVLPNVPECPDVLNAAGFHPQSARSPSGSSHPPQWYRSTNKGFFLMNWRLSHRSWEFGQVWQLDNCFLSVAVCRFLPEWIQSLGPELYGQWRTFRPTNRKVSPRWCKTVRFKKYIWIGDWVTWVEDWVTGPVWFSACSHRCYLCDITYVIIASQRALVSSCCWLLLFWHWDTWNRGVKKACTDIALLQADILAFPWRNLQFLQGSRCDGEFSALPGEFHCCGLPYPCTGPWQ